ncbi:hypothetical protein KAI46_06600, partial [bacterium]|nr:hypothetical protein [bacterium]
APGKHYWFVSGYNPISNTLARVVISEKELDLSSSSDSGTQETELTTKDGDTVMAEFTAWYRIIPEQAGRFLAASGDDDISKMVAEMTKAGARAETALYDAGVLYKSDIRSEFVAAVKKSVNLQLASRGVELTVLTCSKLNFSKELLNEIAEIKQAQTTIEINKIKVQAATVAAQVMEEAAKGRKRAALQESQAQKESVIIASEAQIVAAKNWVIAEKIKAEVMLVRSKAKAEAMQIEAAAKVFSGAEGERFLRYRIADSLADAWAQRNSINSSAANLGLDGVATGISSLSTPLGESSKSDK